MDSAGLGRSFADQGVNQGCMLETWTELLAALLAAAQTMVAGQIIEEAWRHNSATGYYCRSPKPEVARLGHLAAEELRWSVGGDQLAAPLCWQSMEGYDDLEPPLSLLPADD